MNVCSMGLIYKGGKGKLKDYLRNPCGILRLIVPANPKLELIYP